MEVKELGHVVLYVSDLRRSREFYGDVLGFKEVGGFGGSAVGFSSGRTHHELLLIEVGPNATALPPGPRLGMYHFGLKVGNTDDELREAVARLQEAGVQVLGASDHTVTHSLYIRDPDGNEVELYIDVQPEKWREDPALVFAPVKPLQL